MNEHHDELLRSAEQISHQYNEIKALLHSKQKMVVDATDQSIADVNLYFDSYIDELRQTQTNILAEMDKAKQDAQVTIQLLRVNSSAPDHPDSTSLGTSIENRQFLEDDCPGYRSVEQIQCSTTSKIR